MAVEMTDKRYAELGKYRQNAIKAKNRIGRLIKKIENMQYDCDGEVYEELLKIQEQLRA